MISMISSLALSEAIEDRDETNTELRVVIPQPRTARFVAYGCDWCGKQDHDPIKPQDGELSFLKTFEARGETCHCGAPMHQEGSQWVCDDPYCGTWRDGLIPTSIIDWLVTGEVNCPICSESNEAGSACKRCGN